MTREEAVEYILGLQDGVSSRRCASPHEIDANRTEVFNALIALEVPGDVVLQAWVDGGFQ